MFIKNKIKIAGLALLLFVFAVISFDQAHALRIIPPRLVLGPDAKIEYMFIKNNSDKKESFRFGWKHMAMDKEGNVLNIDKIGMENAPQGYKPLDEIIRFSPRRTTIEPGQTQRVTFMINRSKALEAGEYRSHFLVERQPIVEEKDELKIESETTANNEVATPKVEIDVLVSRAVPIYVLNGETNASLSLVSASVKKNAEKKRPDQPGYLAHFKVRKEGNRSVIGRAEVFCNSGGEEIMISKPAKLFAVYAEGEFRNEIAAVQMPPKGCSSYRLLIKGHSDDVLAGQILVNNTFK